MSLQKIAHWGFLSLLIMLSLSLRAQENGTPSFPWKNNTAAFQWADRLISQMTLEEKIGQMIMIPAFGNEDMEQELRISKIIQQYKIGGLIMMQGTPAEQIRLLNLWQLQSRIPLLVAQDAEWGLGMRMKEIPDFPKNMTLGAIQNDTLIYQVGREMARQLKQVGVHLNFAPVADININPANPVINTRSFGENKFQVARKSILVAQGMQDEGVMACAKHFPGHGDTETDSHHALPTLPQTAERLDSTELYPFIQLINKNVGACMVAHLNIPAWDQNETPTSLSPFVIRNLLREKLGFQGLIITDALNMGAVSTTRAGTSVEMSAFLAGNDMLLFPGTVAGTIQTLKEGVLNGQISEREINVRVKRILLAKHSLGLYKPQKLASIDPGNQMAQLIKIHRKRLFEEAITVPLNRGGILPLGKLDRRKIAYVQIGGKSQDTFDKALFRYGQVTPFYLRKGFSRGEGEQLIRKVREYNTVIVGVFGMSPYASRQYGIHTQIPILTENLVQEGKEVILTLFGTPYALTNFGQERAIVVAYEGVEEAQLAAAEAIFGGIAVKGKLPVSAGEKFPVGVGKTWPQPMRVGYAQPEEMGMDSGTLEEIHEIISPVIRDRVIPGCAIMIGRGDKMVYARGFGNMTYEPESEGIDPFLHTYDLASVTKVLATTLSAMKLVEQGRLKLDWPISKYLPEYANSNKARITVRRLLQHNAGLRAWIPFWLSSLEENDQLNEKWYSREKADAFTIQLAPSLYASKAYKDSMRQMIVDSPVRKSMRVNYSDLGLMLMGEIVERLSGKRLDAFADEHFYRPLGMNHTYFNPAEKGYREICPPTEVDRNWRKGEVKGFVHDKAAALWGGVAGHAGLFSNTFDLMKVLMMLKNDGTYGGERYIRPEVIDYFTKQQLSYSRKGLGWDKPSISSRRYTPVSNQASDQSFGHTGFTGTAVWVDPEADLVFIFLTNRTYPYADDRRFYNSQTRRKVMDKVYESITRYQQQKPLPIRFD
ncbi:MAG: glycoside hydrolase family 3 N-terminal domain-containing protein [Bacteroidota bacterium]